MMNYLIILTLSFGMFCKIPAKFKAANKYIVSSLEQIDQTKSIKLSTHKDQISFNLQLVSESIISQDYIEGYSWYKKYGQDTIAIANEIMDSLKIMDIKLNSVKSENVFKTSKLGQITKSDYTVFYSHVYEKTLFAMVVESEYAQSGYMNVQGKGLLYCFKFDDENNIEKVYTGEVHNQ